MSQPVEVIIPDQYVGAMPNQIRGRIDGKPFYFRARHGSWTLEYERRTIAEGEGEQLGEHKEEPGWWKSEDALRFCRQVIDKYLMERVAQ